MTINKRGQKCMKVLHASLETQRKIKFTSKKQHLSILKNRKHLTL